MGSLALVNFIGSWSFLIGGLMTLWHDNKEFSWRFFGVLSFIFGVSSSFLGFIEIVSLIRDYEVIIVPILP